MTIKVPRGCSHTHTHTGENVGKFKDTLPSPLTGFQVYFVQLELNQCLWTGAGHPEQALCPRAGPEAEAERGMQAQRAGAA